MKAFAPNGARWFRATMEELMDSWCEHPEFSELLYATRLAWSFSTKHPSPELAVLRVRALCKALHRSFHPPVVRLLKEKNP
jgi:hypothetical protein